MKYMRSVQKVRLRQVRDGRVRFAVDKVNRPQDVWEALLPFYRGADREMLSVLCVDAQNRPTCFQICSVGNLNTTRTNPREILKVAILSNAAAIILIHNHPSGLAEASEEDLEFTKAVKRSCDAMGLELYDHLIVTDDAHYSMREHGVM